MIVATLSLVLTVLPLDVRSATPVPVPVPVVEAPPATLDDRIQAVVPTEAEDRWRTVPWRTNLMLARQEAQRVGRPIFLWIMVGNPQGCT